MVEEKKKDGRGSFIREYWALKKAGSTLTMKEYSAQKKANKAPLPATSEPVAPTVAPSV